jgi:hypothetical protein
MNRINNDIPPKFAFFYKPNRFRDMATDRDRDISQNRLSIFHRGQKKMKCIHMRRMDILFEVFPLVFSWCHY